MNTNEMDPPKETSKKKATRRNVSNQALYRAIEARLTVYGLTPEVSVAELLNAVKDEWFQDQV